MLSVFPLLATVTPRLHDSLPLAPALARATEVA